MAEIVCPHCHSTVPRDGAFCARCRSFITSSAAGEQQEDADEAAPAAAAVRQGPSSAKDVVGEAVRSSMATSGRGSWELLSETGDDPADPYPSDTELRRGEPKRRPRAGHSATMPDAGAKELLPPLTRGVALLVALPGSLRTACRRLGALPVTVFVAVLALLGSGGLLHAVGAFDESLAAAPDPDTPAKVLSPSSYKASCAAGPSVDAAGEKVTFGAAHLFDGKTRTAWRCAGDGSKQRVTLSFARPVRVTRVAVVPGWATKDKTSKADRFAENGAPRVVTWRFDETSVRHRIGKPRPAWAGLPLDSPARTKTVALRIDAVREGDRRAMVAVSEIRVLGHPR